MRRVNVYRNYFESELGVVRRIEDIHKAHQYNCKYLRMAEHNTTNFA